MKNLHFNKASLVLIFLFSFLSVMPKVFAQEAEKKLYKTRMSMTHFKNTHGDKLLTARLTSRINKKLVNIEGEGIQFFILTDSSEMELGKEVTDEKGNATLLLPGDLSDKRDTAGYYAYEARFEGSDSLKSSDADLSVKDAILSIELGLDDDSLKMITVEGFGLNAANEKEAIKEADIYIYIQRLFGKMKVDDDVLEDGSFEYTFDEEFSIPGDVDGNITIIASIEDSDEFGNLESVQEINWGTPVIVESEQSFAKTTWFRMLLIGIIFVIPAALLLLQIFKYLRQ